MSFHIKIQTHNLIDTKKKKKISSLCTLKNVSHTRKENKSKLSYCHMRIEILLSLKYN